MSPIIPGIFNLLSTIGESKIMKSRMENTNTGFFSGS
jgi:hypothetical protein